MARGTEDSEAKGECRWSGEQHTHHRLVPDGLGAPRGSTHPWPNP